MKFALITIRRNASIVINSTNHKDLRKAKTNQVIVTYSVLNGNTYSPTKMHGIYDSFDQALQEICGYSWTHIKANWQYNDYKSQGQPFMNTYAEGVTGKTVATRNLVDPYSYSFGEGITYYFE